MAIDLNDIRCSCSNEHCLVGIRFDSDPTALIFQDKKGEDHIMQLDIDNINELIDTLKKYRKHNKKK